MGELLKFPKLRRSTIDIELIQLLARALKLNGEFLEWSLGHGAFDGNPDRKEAVIDLIEANACIIAEAGRKKP